MHEPTIEDQLRAGILAQKDTGAVASPSKAYVKYILEDDNIPDDIHPALRRVVFDKELALTNLRDEEIPWLRRQLQLAEITFKMSRPALECNYTEEIMLSTLPMKHVIKLSRSRDGGFERRQQTTQTVIKRVEGVSSSTPVSRRVGRLRRLLPGGGER
jgi:hypothetical protein